MDASREGWSGTLGARGAFGADAAGGVAGGGGLRSYPQVPTCMCTAVGVPAGGRRPAGSLAVAVAVFAVGAVGGCPVTRDGDVMFLRIKF